MDSRTDQTGETGGARVDVPGTGVQSWMGAAAAGTASNGSGVTAGTAVFVGRASFRMVPTGVEVTSDDEPLSGTPLPLLAEAESPWFAPSERVVLLPPESVIRAAGLTPTPTPIKPGAIQEMGRETGQEKGQEIGIVRAPRGPESSSASGRIDLQRKTAGRPSMPLWAVAAALVVGATATLSAQAVMRRPAAHPPSVTAPIVRAAAGEAIAAAAAEGAPAIAAGPTVVPSTLTQPTPTTAATSTDSGSDTDSDTDTVADTRQAAKATSNGASGARELRRAGQRPSTAATAAAASKAARVPTAARQAAVAATPSTTWVDPFVADTAASTAATMPGRATTPHKGRVGAFENGAQVAKRTASSSSRPASKSIDAAWVDPFVN